MTPTGIPRVDRGDVKTSTRTILCLLTLTALLWVTALAATATPDLVVAEFRVTPESPYPGMTVSLEAVIRNVGDDDADGQFFVRFSIDQHVIEDVAVSTGLRAGQERSISATWIAEEGRHTLTAEADGPFDRIHEIDEFNNLASQSLRVPFPSDVSALTGGATVAVRAFFDHSESGLLDVGTGVSDKLVDQLTQAGVRTVSRFELEETMRQQGLNPYSPEDVAAAARSAGADYVLVGYVASLGLSESAITLGALSIGTASADVQIDADLLLSSTRELVGSFSATGQHESTTELSLDLVSVLSQPDGGDPCAGGLQTDRDAYAQGESVRIGFRNPAPDAWYSVEIYSSSGAFLQWLGWRYVPMGECGEWIWNQRDTFGTQVAPSVYVARISDGASQFASITFQVRPGSGLFPLADTITVGSPSFESSVAGEAINEAIGGLMIDIIPMLEASAVEGPHLALGALEDAEDVTEARIAAILPDGRVAINIGASSGVSRGDFFLIVDESGGEVRGEIVIVEVRDNVSYAVRSTDFEPHIGDIAVPVSP